MALTTHAEIRSEIIDHLEQLREMRDPEDLLHELAERVSNLNLLIKIKNME